MSRCRSEARLRYRRSWFSSCQALLPLMADGGHIVKLTSATTRVAMPDNVGCVVAGLLSADSGWVNAQDIEVAGGYNI